MNVYIDHCTKWVFITGYPKSRPVLAIKDDVFRFSVLILITVTHLFRVLKTIQAYASKQLFYAININNRLAKPNKG